MSEINDIQRALIGSAGGGATVVGSAETLIPTQDGERNLNFASIDQANVVCYFAAKVARLNAGTTSTFRVRVGGTIGGIDGTVVATITVTGAEAQAINVGSSFTKPSGANGDLVKVTAQGDDAASVSTIEGITIQFKGV